MKYELVSVIMPVRKSNPFFLNMSIKSILDQTFSNFELLIIYEKSFNKIDCQIESVFDRYEHDHRLKLIKLKKSGFTNSLNVGIKEAKGEFLARMDADDISELTRFEEQLNYLVRTKSDLIGSWAYSISEEGKVLSKIQLPITHKQIRKQIMLHNPFLHPSILFHRSVIDKVGNYNEKFDGAEDYDFYFRVLSAGFKLANMPKYLIRLRETKSSLMRGKGWRNKRMAYLKVKENAVKNLGFRTGQDLFFYGLTPFALLVTPKVALFLKKMIGYYKS